MKNVWLALTLMLVAGSAHGEIFFENCNGKGFANKNENADNAAFWNRMSNNGKGNGGESFDLLVDLESGDVFVTCVQTVDEDTQGTLFVQLPDGGPIIPLGPIDWDELDPGNESPTPNS